MSLRRSVLGFLLRLTLAYGLLTAAWLEVGDAYGTAFRAVCGAVFGSFGSEGVVRFQLHPHPEGEKETAMVMSKRGEHVATWIMLSARYMGYSPATLVVALIIATPMRWRRKLLALLMGIVLISGFTLLRLWVGLLLSFGTSDVVRLYELTPFWKSILEYGNEVLCLSVTAMYVVSALVWILVSFRRGELTALVEKVRGG